MVTKPGKRTGFGWIPIIRHNADDFSTKKFGMKFY